MVNSVPEEAWRESAVYQCLGWEGEEEVGQQTLVEIQEVDS